MVVRYPSNGAKVEGWFGNFEKFEVFKIFTKQCQQKRSGQRFMEIQVPHQFLMT